MYEIKLSEDALYKAVLELSTLVRNGVEAPHTAALLKQMLISVINEPTKSNPQNQEEQK